MRLRRPRKSLHAILKKINLGQRIDFRQYWRVEKRLRSSILKYLLFNGVTTIIISGRNLHLDDRV